MTIRHHRHAWALPWAAALLLATTAARAEDPKPLPGVGPGQGRNSAWCQENPEKCAEMKARREELCKTNPEKCARQKQRFEERQAWCQQNPEACAKQREERKARMEEMRAKCEADPAKCEEMRAKARERWEQGGKGPRGPQPESPAP